MVNTVGHRTTEMALQLGLLYSPADALKVGLVDQLVPEDQVLTTASQAMTKWLAIPGTFAVKLLSDRTRRALCAPPFSVHCVWVVSLALSAFIVVLPEEARHV